MGLRFSDRSGIYKHTGSITVKPKTDMVILIPILLFRDFTRSGDKMFYRFPI